MLIADTMTFFPDRRCREFSGIRHTYDRTTSCTRTFNPLARGYPRAPIGNFLLRQCWTRLRASIAGAVFTALTATVISETNHLHRRPTRWSPTPSVVPPRERPPMSTVTYRTDTITFSPPRNLNKRESTTTHSSLTSSRRLHGIVCGNMLLLPFCGRVYVTVFGFAGNQHTPIKKCWLLDVYKSH